ncbi:AAA family ATPase [Burkholderia arboris]|uniref:AAA family ATPase n=1 Tax=Burkholderia arboris TaxID=488730 RepID=UPI00158C7633|nr:AAA family ATPase [Burkholderia arboris]
MPHNNDLVWLHLSDIHFHPTTSWRDNATRRKLLDFLGEEFDNDLPRPQLVFCTGDIAFGETSGAPLSQQYDDAAKFFDELMACCRLPRDRLFIVPGNHDVNRKEISRDQQNRLIEMAGKDSLRHAEEINQRFADCSRDHRTAMERLKDYGEFVKRYRPELHRDDYHLYAHTLNVNGYQIGIAGFNSAWSCAGDEDDRHIWLAGNWQFNHMDEKLRGADLKIGLIHHPFDWLNAAEQHDAEARASSALHFMLHGHTHTAWVRAGDASCTYLAAGAVGADTPDQFGINLVRLDPQSGECCAYLFGYNRDWVIHPVRKHAPLGRWAFRSSVRATPRPVTASPEPDRTEVQSPAASTHPSASPGEVLFGRTALLDSLASRLTHKPGLVLHGMSGNGKTTLIKALHGNNAFQAMRFIDVRCSRQMTVGELFRRFLDVLQSRREDPRPPSGSLEAQVTDLNRQHPNAQPAFVWIDDAHLLLDDTQWRNPDIRTLLRALSMAFPKWKWAYEFNEKPADGSFGSDFPTLEIPGLDKAGLADLLAHSAPPDQKADWVYTGPRLKALFQWLGGGHGGAAHTLAAELLATVAREQGKTPFQVYQNLRQEVIDRLDEKLLGILHDEVLGEGERSLLKVVALYRKAIPQDHADGLEDGLGITDAWQKLRARGLLPLDNNKDHYLHGFIVSWMRQKQMALGDITLTPDYADTIPPAVAAMHVLIARCWQRQIGRQKEEINVQRANEAFYHLLCANELGEVEEWIGHLTGKDIGWSNDALWAIYHRRRDAGESIARQQEVLQLLVNIHPREHKALRFLGECLRVTQGAGCDETLQVFEQALDLDPEFPPYLANLGKTLLARGRIGAEIFLERLEAHEKRYPHAVDGHVQAIKADCLNLVGNAKDASHQRRQTIANGSLDAAFYADEAKYLMEHGSAPEALRLLNLACKRQCANDYTEHIRGHVLDILGRGPEASALRMAKIEAGNRHSAFYNDEAKYQMTQGNYPEALRILNMAHERQCENDYTLHTRALVLKRLRQDS